MVVIASSRRDAEEAMVALSSLTYTVIGWLVVIGCGWLLWLLP